MAIRKQTHVLYKRILKSWAPPPTLTVSQWADEYRVLSAEDSAEPGKWSTDRAPYQREPMDALSDPETKKVVLMWSAQLGKTAIELNVVGYFIHQDPSPILVAVPNKDPIAKDWSKDRLAPMIRDTPVLTERVSDPKARDGENSTLHKKFPGGLIVIAGANAPSDLASRPIRILLADEVDRFPLSAGSEGDPISLVEKRQQTFWNRKEMLVSTPTIEGESRIESEYKKGTREKYFVTCPDCGEYVFIDFYGMVYETTWINEDVAEISDILFKCPNCFCINDEQTMKRQPGAWIASNPEVKGTRSFHINAFYSPWYTWEAIIKEYVEAKNDPMKLQVVVNTLFGIPYKEKLNLDDEEKLAKRREEYKADLPDGVLLLTCGVDTQDDRLEYEIVGWGKDDESWGIEYGVIIGKADDKETWNMLDDRLNKIYKFKDGKGLKVAYTFVDSGGHFTTDVYKYCKRNEHRRIFPIKGRGGKGIPLINSMTRKNKENVALILLGVDDGKTTIMSALNVKEPGPRYCHFPLNDDKGYDKNYFHCLLSEHEELKIVKGKKKYEWVKNDSGGRNEALDTRNYAQAAKQIIKPNYEALETRLNGSVMASKTAPMNTQKSRNRVKKTDIY